MMNNRPNSFFNNNEDKFVFRLIRFIKEEHLVSGDKLPSIRSFADDMDLSQSQVRSGIMRAAALGIVEMRSRSGCYVSDLNLTNLVSTFSLLFEAMYMNEDNPLIEIYDLKTTLERSIAKRVARIRTVEDLVELKRILDMMDKADNQPEMVRLDEMYHNKLAEISRNSLYYSLINIIHSLLRESRLHYSNFVSEFPTSLMQHEELYQAIKEQDEEAAAGVAETHSNRRKHLIIENTL